ncbi:MAG: DNA-formamidopyrimidine glycosylase family protein [Ilumatobacteraceae bacterium]
MPEGHTLHRLARQLDERFAGRPVAVSSPQGRFEAGAALVDGRRLDEVSAYGKHLFASFGDLVVHVHLGLYGKVSEGHAPASAPWGALRMRWTNEDWWSDLRGATACEVVTHDEAAAIVARLGPDPLARRPDGARAWRRISRSRAPIGVLLMDQSVIAGVGNVYRAEVLFRQRRSPFDEGRTLSEEEWHLHVGGHRRSHARRRPSRVDRHDPCRGSSPRAGARRGRPLRVPQGRTRVSHLWHARRRLGDGGTQPVLVPHLPASMTRRLAGGTTPAGPASTIPAPPT